MTVRRLEGTAAQQSRGYSPGVVTEGGRIVWLSGHTALVDRDGHSIAYDIEAQTRTVFALIGETLAREGGTLADLVMMSVYLVDPRHSDRFIELRREILGEGPYPASALLVISHFGRPGIVLEVQGFAVLGAR